MDICTTTTPRHLHYRVSNGFMREALHCKCQSDPCCKFAVKKSDEHAKTPSWFVYTEVYSPLHFSVVVERRETAYEN